MSSACVCHTDEWCFYCEMYVPLEKKHEEQRMGVERVIAELELDYEIAINRLSEPMSQLGVGYWNAVKDKSGSMIRQLKEVLNTEPDTTNQQHASKP